MIENTKECCALPGEVVVKGLYQDSPPPAHSLAKSAIVALVVDNQPSTAERSGAQVAATTARIG